MTGIVIRHKPVQQYGRLEGVTMVRTHLGTRLVFEMPQSRLYHHLEGISKYDLRCG